MNRQRAFLFLFCLVLAALPGCRHPLAIVGEGDIVERNGSGRGCSLEQFRAEHDSCVVNDVEGDYFVNYFARPRPGWRFLRWEGPCAPNSEFQHCRVQLPRHVIEQWEQSHGDASLPASTAVFQRISGETGYLLAGTPVAGVSYTTPTGQGVTGADGSFQYAPGETVTFSIGATVLGAVSGSARITPFELAGAPVLTGPELVWALDDGDDPLSTVINLTVLLQSLDRDGNPANGIAISRGIAELLARLQLDVREQPGAFLLIPDPEGEIPREAQDWESFQRDHSFLHLLGQARRQKRFSVAHGVVTPATAMAGLYRELGIDPRLVGLAEQRSNTADGEFWNRFSYDAAGNLTRQEINGFGGAYETWQYDDRGLPVVHEEHADELGHHLVSNSYYDAAGRLVREETDFSGNGAWARYLRQLENHYDDDGNPVEQVESRTGEGGTQTYTDSFRYSYDAHGRLSQYVSEFDEQGADGSDFHSVEYFDYGYDAAGNLRRFSQAMDAVEVDGVPETSRIVWFDAQGRATRFESILTPFPVEEPAAATMTWHYDDAGRIVRHRSFSGLSWRFRYEYDERGLPMKRERISTLDDSVEEVVTWRRDGDGRILSREEQVKVQAYEGASEETLLEGWRYHPNGRIALYSRERMGAELEWLDESREYRFDEGGRLVSFTSTFNFEDFQGQDSYSWQYDANGRLTRAERIGADDARHSLESWQYDSAGRPIRYDVDEDGDGVAEESRQYRYVDTGWGYLFAGVSPFGLRRPLPDRPGANREEIPEPNLSPR